MDRIESERSRGQILRVGLRFEHRERIGRQLQHAKLNRADPRRDVCGRQYERSRVDGAVGHGGAEQAVERGNRGGIAIDPVVQEDAAVVSHAHPGQGGALGARGRFGGIAVVDGDGIAVEIQK